MRLLHAEGVHLTQGWVDAANRLAAERGLPLRAHTVGLEGCDFVDVRMAWMKNRGISSSGVVIVRPDRYVAYRSVAGVPDADSELRRVFDSLLAVTPGSQGAGSQGAGSGSRLGTSESNGVAAAGVNGVTV